MEKKRILDILRKIRKVKVAVYGDFCLDAYWLMDPGGSEISVETGLKAEAVRQHYYSPGGASNIVANLAALDPAGIRAIGVLGKDLFGRELLQKLKDLKVDTQSLILQEKDFDTYTFVKRYDQGEEQPRIDFGLQNIRSAPTDRWILEQLEHALNTVDVLIVNQQVPGSITRRQFLDQMNELFYRNHDTLILLDSRHYNDRIQHVALKTNATEIARMNGVTIDPDKNIPLSRIEEFGIRVFKNRGKPVFVTCGERGMLTFDESGIHRIPGIHLLKKLDPVGAGDTSLSALALSLAAGFTPSLAAEFANLAAAVTVQKLFVTGTASADEILETGKDPDYIYQPDLADSPENAEYLPDSKIEVCERTILDIRYPLKHVVFDHDGTVSTLRAGWEGVMQKFMIKTIMGNPLRIEQKKILERVTERVEAYIDQSTGIQTIVQMKALADMVEEFDLIPVPDRKDEFVYKKQYLKELMKMVNKRIKKIKTGEMSRHQYMIPGVIRFLESLKKSGIRLYLASGTDQPDVLKEAGILGYAGIFGNNIFGSRNDVKTFSKKILIEKILYENKLHGNELMVVGDGPVEIRECRKKEGLAVGMATREDGKEGINMEKRRRLIRAGAHLVLPDFTKGDKLLSLIHS